MVRRRVIATIVAGANIALTACGGTGTHTQDLSPSPSGLSSSTSQSPTSSSAPTSPTTSTASKVSEVPTPSVTPAAQGAVNAYIAFYNQSGLADRDPADADLGALDQYLSGKARTLFDGIYADMKKAGLAYRGTPPDPRVTVKSVGSATFVILTSCPLVSTNDPYVEYQVNSGTPVAAGPMRTPPPPYRLTLPMAKTGSQWQLTDVLQDTSKTCKG